MPLSDQEIADFQEDPSQLIDTLWRMVDFEDNTFCWVQVISCTGRKVHVVSLEHTPALHEYVLVKELLQEFSAFDYIGTIDDLKDFEAGCLISRNSHPDRVYEVVEWTRGAISITRSDVVENWNTQLYAATALREWSSLTPEIEFRAQTQVQRAQQMIDEPAPTLVPQTASRFELMRQTLARAAQESTK